MPSCLDKKMKYAEINYKKNDLKHKLLFSYKWIAFLVRGYFSKENTICLMHSVVIKLLDKLCQLQLPMNNKNNLNNTQNTFTMDGKYRLQLKEENIIWYE